MQIATIAGKLGKDATLASTQSGDKVCNFSVAVDYREGREKKTQWWRASLWGKRAEALSPYLLKGVSVTVAGEIGLTEYEGKPQLNIRASDVALQGSRNSGGGQQQNEQQSSGGWGGGSDDLDDDRIPF